MANTVDRVEVRVRGTRYLIRKNNQGGLVTYTVEDWRGNIVTELINPEVNFNEWVGDYVRGLVS